MNEMVIPAKAELFCVVFAFIITKANGEAGLLTACIYRERIAFMLGVLVR